MYLIHDGNFHAILDKNGDIYRFHFDGHNWNCDGFLRDSPFSIRAVNIPPGMDSQGINAVDAEIWDL